MNKYILCFLPLLLFVEQTNSQEPLNLVVGYTYDQNGNRISKDLVFMPNCKNKRQTSEELECNQSENPLLDYVGTSEIMVYPNPTMGLVKVKINDRKPNDIWAIWLLNGTGHVLQKGKFSGEEGQIDITNKPSGVYLLKITDGESSTIWKIIKQ